MEVSKKVIIAGHFGVGKSSLIKQFIHEKFSEQYMTTIGVKIDKKVVDVDGARVNMILWDIAGESSATKIPKKYFMGAHGLIYVFDLTRPESYERISDDIFEVTKDNPQIPSVVLGNKSDLVKDEFIEEIRSEIGVGFNLTSAKTGDNVESSFKSLAKEML
ncbi:MAG: Rab family GTPase [Ekhidna sp.]